MRQRFISLVLISSFLLGCGASGTAVVRPAVTSSQVARIASAEAAEVTTLIQAYQRIEGYAPEAMSRRVDIL